jgi:RimJ/RimL family protein N-acetyltransferase
MAASQRKLSSAPLPAQASYDLVLVPLPLDVARRMLGSGLRPARETLRPARETPRPEPKTMPPEPVEGPFSWHAEYPMPDSLDAIALALASHHAMTGKIGDPPAWWVHHIVVDGVVVGDIGFHGPPGPERTVEIGYSVVPAWRGHGVASRACDLILQRAWQDGADIVIAETDHHNVASQAVLLRNGFRRGPDGVFTIKRPGAR